MGLTLRKVPATLTPPRDARLECHRAYVMKHRPSTTVLFLSTTDPCFGFIIGVVWVPRRHSGAQMLPGTIRSSESYQRHPSRRMH